MAQRKSIDCRDYPSEKGCTLKISGTEQEVLDAAVVEKRTNEFEQLLARREESEWTAIEQFGAKRLFEARNLSTDRGLLDAVRHIADRWQNSSMAGDVIEQLEVVNIHDRNSR